MVLVLHKELEYKVEKLRYKTVGGRSAKDQSQIRNQLWTSSWQIDNAVSVHTEFYGRDWSIQSIISWWRMIRGGDRGLLFVFPWSWGGGALLDGGGLFEREGLIEDLR